MSDPRYGFQVPLRVEYLPDGKWKVLRPIRYLSALTQKAYTVERGFIYNFASVPRLPFVYWLAGNTAHLAATVHDFLYAHAHIPLSTKQEADDVFAEIMDAGTFWNGGPYDRQTGEPEWRRVLMWQAVTWFGPDYWLEREHQYGFQLEPLGD
jgi:hypothetical protein